MRKSAVANKPKRAFIESQFTMMIVSESMQTKTKLMMVYSKAKELEDQSAIPFLKVPPQMMRQIAKYIS